MILPIIPNDAPHHLDWVTSLMSQLNPQRHDRPIFDVDVTHPWLYFSFNDVDVVDGEHR